MPTNAEHLVEALTVSGVRQILGIAGDSLNGLTDAVRASEQLRWVNVRHEESAAFAAGALAAVTGELAVCAGSAGPGNMHLVNGLHDAQRSRVPVLAVAAHVPQGEIGSGYFQETNPERLFADCSVYCATASTAEMFPRVLHNAMRAAVEEQGVAVVVVPGEVLLADVEGDHPAPRPIRRAPRHVVPGDAELDEAAAILGSSEAVTILAGAGCAGAHDHVVELARTLQAPVVHALRGKEHLAYDNPLDVGMTGLLGTTSGEQAVSDAEVLLMLGTDLPYREFYPSGARVIQVDVRGSVIGRRTDVELPLVGTVADTITALLPRLTPREENAHLRAALAEHECSRQHLDHLAADDAAPVRPERTTDAVSRLASDDAIVTVDVGSPVMWASRHLAMTPGRRLVGSFVHGSMAGALPQAIGAQLADPDRQVIALAGDGGLTMLLGELLTLVQEDLPVTVVVYDNASLNFVELEMKAVGVVPFATGLHDPDLAGVARAMGLHAQRVEDPADLDDALRAALAHPGPSLVDVVTPRHVVTIPPSVSAEQVKGFALYGIRTVLAGKAEELVETARTNAPPGVLRRVLGALPGGRDPGERAD